MGSIIVLIFLALVIVALIYFRRLTSNPQQNSINGDSENIRYDSKISLCSLIYDSLNSILHISYGKKSAQIVFSHIAAFEVTVDTSCLIKISKNDAQIFDVEAEENLRSQLITLEKETLSKDATRQISIEIFSEPEAEVKPILVNFYYREGDHRLSPHSFSRSIDDVLLWCGLLESAIRPGITEEPEASLDAEEYITEPLDTFEQADSEIQPNSDATQAMHNSYDLADELTRLADLKTKGLLSDEEFKKAKDKIIN